MNTKAISNGAMNYENAPRRLKISELEMKVEDDYLYVKISSPFLSGNNHAVSVQKNRLSLKITDVPKAGNPIPMPLQCDLFLPKDGYKSIKKEEAAKGSITMQLSKKSSKKMRLNTQIA